MPCDAVTSAMGGDFILRVDSVRAAAAAEAGGFVLDPALAARIAYSRASSSSIELHGMQCKMVSSMPGLPTRYWTTLR